MFEFKKKYFRISDILVREVQLEPNEKVLVFRDSLKRTQNF